ncbi:type IV toxin-antitoxin system AbiEi family antitoxin domain-containing protein, partial [Micromonospora sp. NPDC050187]|uniref:type IV toxin-antitoxin system AbiEi family antitoxin domain-containing protein n=1 Tax=Micromonospora sp. NPDC050187 TaxID=3364277 RepID=UPI0037A6F144
MTPFALLRHLAAAQGGIVTAAQALGAGLGRDEIRQLCRSGRWLRLARGCYLPVPALAAREPGMAAARESGAAAGASGMAAARESGAAAGASGMAAARESGAAAGASGM